MTRALAAPCLVCAPQYAMNPASRVFPPVPGEAPRAQLRPGRWRDELPIVILNADWAPTISID